MLTTESFFALRTRLLALSWAVSAFCFLSARSDRFRRDNGAIVRGDESQKKIALVLTGHEFADGGALIAETLREKKAPASFFFTGDFYREPRNAALIRGLVQDGHYLGPHSDKHLLYCSWERRDELLVTKEEFTADILQNYRAMESFGLSRKKAPLFIPPYEWYNRTIAGWAQELGLLIINFTPGTYSNADYTTPEMPNYLSSKEIFRSILNCERSDPAGLNEFILLLHIGTHPDRKDKFYRLLGPLLAELHKRGYAFVRVDELLADRRKEEHKPVVSKYRAR
jgi:peptidoglycan/xylan/chitin deacetylase (PgdA/CDA1 family)